MVTAMMTAGLVVGLTSDRVLSDWAPLVTQEPPIPHSDFPLAQQPTSAEPDDTGLRDATWPEPGKAAVTTGAAARPAGNLPVTLASEKDARSFAVEVHDQEITQRAGVTGVLFTVTPEDAEDEADVSVGVDYSAFANAAGADFGSRLRLVRLPDCALTTPGAAQCQVQSSLKSSNDPQARTVTARTTGTGPMAFAVTAAGSGTNGTFEASALAPSGNWSVSGSAGGFHWSYPVVLPPSSAGSAVAPKVALSYSSSSVDGRTLATNNQSSWLGQGWDYSPGAIERTYRTCAQDKTLPQAQQTGDLCWAGQIVTMVLDGKSTELVRDDATGTWRASTDGGARIELVTGAVNGVHNGEYWKVTNTAGVSYYFGRNRGPGHTDQEQTNSAWTVPVYGPRNGDPCYNPGGFAQSSCAQAWRWNLDFVEDTHGNVTSYYYTPETNHYGANNATTGVSYTRGGTLKRIDYGLRTVDGSIYGAAAPNQVVFDVAERCLPDATFDCDPAKFTTDDAKRWPDTPQDQQCKPGAVCNNHSPTFWSTKRLTTITTQYNQGSGPVTVDRYQLGQEFKDIANKELWLQSITRTGFAKDGTSLTVPPVTFTGQVFDNRVQGYSSMPGLVHWRVTNIATETGTSINVFYSQRDCGATDVPTDLANNNRRCYPVYWTLPFNENPTLDYFHKYVVDRVEVQDRNGISPTQVTAYTYLGAPAWHYDDSEIVKPEHRTYGQFRGYGKVEQRAGNPNHTVNGVHDKQTLTRTTYFRGMDGDTMPGDARRPAKVANSLNEEITDHRQFADMTYEQEVFNGAGGKRISTTVTEPQVLGATATRQRSNLPALTAEVVGVSRDRTITHLAAGDTRTVTNEHRYDALGRLIAKTESGDEVPDLCTTTRYADNTTTWVRNRVAESTVSQQACPTGGTPQSSILGSTRTYYDESTTLAEVTSGTATRVDAATDNNNDQLTYETTATAKFDAAGRSTEVTDAIGHATRTAYTPTDGGILTKTVTTNAKNQTNTVELDPARGNPVVSLDVGSRRTDATYDPLGRLTAVWKPSQSKGFDPPTVTYDYVLRADGPLAVTSKTFVDYRTGTNYVAKIDLFDAFGRLRQSQTDALDGGRVVTDLFHDSHGRVRHTNGGYIATGAPGTNLISVDPKSVDSRSVTDYDGAGRAVLETAYKGVTPTWTTKTVHGGDRVTVIPPRGGVTTTVVSDARGRTTENHKYTAPPTVNGDVVSGGTHQTATTEYTALGQTKKLTDPVGNHWTFTYDLLGRKTSQTDPDTGTSTTTYDLAGQILTTTDARRNTLVYKYDELGRKTAQHADSTDGPLLASWLYDGAQNGVGLPWYSTRHTPEGNYISGVSAYTGAGWVGKTIVQIPAAETGLNALYTTTYGYTTTGLPTAVQPPTANRGGLPGEVIGTTYDKYGKPVTTAGYNAYVTASVYTPYGESRQFTLGPSNNTAKLTYDYDAQTRRLTQTNLSAQQADPQIDDTRYTYDPAGNVTKTVNTQGTTGRGAPVRTQCYSYDPLRRLDNAWTATDDCAAAPSTTAGTANVGGPTPYWTSWAFEPGGLRTTQTQHALPGSTGDTTTTYTYPTSGSPQPHTLTNATTTGPSGQTLSTYGYDPSGNTTRRTLPTGEHILGWDRENRLDTVTSPNGPTKYVYDADGNQLIRRDPDKTTLYLAGQELTRDNTTGAIVGTRYYTHNGVNVALRVGNTNPTYLVSDLHNTMSLAVGSVGFAVSRRTMDPYGNQLNPAAGLPWPDRHGFLNKPVSEATGLTDIGARNYDATTGRFISVDPILDLNNAQQWTGYTYADNNPTTYSDPTGLIANCGPDGDGCGMPNYDNVGADPDNMDNPDNWGTTEWGGGFSTAYDYETEEYYIGNYSLGKHSAKYGAQLRRQIIKQLLGEDHNSRALYGELDEAELLSQLEKACERVKDCQREMWGDIFPHNYGVYGSLGEGILGSAASYKALKKPPGGSKAMCPNSFTGDTLILMGDGNAKRIDQIKVGEAVLNSEPEVPTSEKHLVTQVHVTTEDKHYVDVVVDTPGGAKTIRTTAHHPIYSATAGKWTNAEDLSTGDELNTPGNGRAVVLDTHRYVSESRTYNLSVEGVHTFYVVAGETPVLVHNDGGYTPPPPGKKLPGFPDARYVGRGSPVKGGGSRARWELPNGGILEWDSMHGTVEMWTNKKKNAKHVGEFDPNTGKQLPGQKGQAVPGRKLGDC
ncbi:colicin E3/pyocin S6 family cytotoxin [Actinosynnema sp. NPDC023794]